MLGGGLSFSTGSPQPRGPSSLWKSLPHLQSLGSSVLTPPGAPPSSDLWLDMKAQDRLGERAQPRGSDCSHGAVQGTCSARHLPLHPSISCCLCWALGSLLSAQPVPPSPPPRFMEYEAEEEMQLQKLQWMKGAQGLPPPAPRRPDSWGPPAPEVGPQPGMTANSHKSPWPKAIGA